MNDVLNFKIKAIAANIRNKREYRNYTQEYLAAKLNVSQNTYSKIELGYVQLTIERLTMICHVLDINMRELFPSTS